MSNWYKEPAGSESTTTFRLCDVTAPRKPKTRIAATIRGWKQWVIITALFKLLAQLLKVGIAFELRMWLDEPDPLEGAEYEAPSSAPEKTQEHVGLASTEVRTPN